MVFINVLVSPIKERCLGLTAWLPTLISSLSQGASLARADPEHRRVTLHWNSWFSSSIFFIKLWFPQGRNPGLFILESPTPRTVSGTRYMLQEEWMKDLWIIFNPFNLLASRIWARTTGTNELCRLLRVQSLLELGDKEKGRGFQQTNEPPLQRGIVWVKQDFVG